MYLFSFNVNSLVFLVRLEIDVWFCGVVAMIGCILRLANYTAKLVMSWRSYQIGDVDSVDLSVHKLLSC